MIELLLKIFDILVPRFVTEHIACNYIGNDEYKAICLLEDIGDADFDHICEVKWLNLFSFPLFVTSEIFEVVDG